MSAATILEHPAEHWPALIPLSSPTLPQLRPEWIPGWAGDFIAAEARSTETPPELATGMVLSVLSAAAARRLRVKVRHGWYEPCNLWIVSALPPGNRKSVVQRDATRPLMAWEKERSEAMEPEIRRAESERKTEEARAKALRQSAAGEKDRAKAHQLAEEAADIEESLTEVPRAPMLWASDVTPERLGTLLANSGECLAWLSSEGGIFETLGGRYSQGVPNLDLALKAHDGDSERVERGSRPPVWLREPLLTIGLSPQPEVLRGLSMKPGFRGRGLLARFLYLLPVSPLGYRTGNAPAMPDAVRGAYEAAVRAMLDWPENIGEDGSERPYLLLMTPEATEVLHQYGLDIEPKMRPGGDFEHCTDWAGKAQGTAARLAGVLHAIEYTHGEPWAHPIEAQTVGRALEIMEVCTEHSLAAFDLMGADPTIAAARRVWEWLNKRRQPRVKMRDAFQALKGRFPKMAALSEAVAILEERGYVELREIETSGPGRKPSPWIVVRPDIADGWQ